MAVLGEKAINRRKSLLLWAAIVGVVLVWRFGLLLVLPVISFVSPPGVRVILANRSGRSLNRVTLGYSGGTCEWASIRDEERVEVVVVPKWESGLSIAFTDVASGKRTTAGVGVYMESYSRGRILIIVPPTLRIEYENRIWW